MAFSAVVLPEPLGPMRPTILPWFDGQVKAIESLHVAEPLA